MGGNLHGGVAFGSGMTPELLEEELLAAHANRDLHRLARGYARAADLAELGGQVDQACFFLTQGWIFALEAGDPLSDTLKARLIAHGREAPG